MNARHSWFLILLAWFASCAQGHATSSAFDRALNDLRSLQQGVEQYRNDHNDHLPPQEQWKDALSAYIKSSQVFVDPWKHPYIYRMPGRHADYEFYSLGRNGIDDGGDGDDINSWVGINPDSYGRENRIKGIVMLFVGAFLGLFVLLHWRRYSARFVLPIALGVLCFFVVLACDVLQQQPLLSRSAQSSIALAQMLCAWLLIIPAVCAIIAFKRMISR